MDLNKSTHDEYRTELFMPIMKEAEGKYIAVLSDNSTDRDEESCSKGCIEELGKDDGYLAALCNHNNDVFMQVAEWRNKGCREIDGYTALVAEPKFFMSNPNAKIIKGMLDEGAKIGISIGAIVKEYDEGVNGNRIFTRLELLEASFVAIPSNRHGRAMAVAKSFNNKKNKRLNKEALKVEKEFTQKDIDSAIEKEAKIMKADFTKQLESKNTEITKLKDDLKKSEEEADKVKNDTEAEKVDAEKKFKEATEKATKEINDVKDAALEKMKFASQGGVQTKKLTEDEVEKSYKDGKLPIMRM